MLKTNQKNNPAENLKSEGICLLSVEVDVSTIHFSLLQQFLH